MIKIMIKILKAKESVDVANQKKDRGFTIDLNEG